MLSLSAEVKGQGHKVTLSLGTEWILTQKWNFIEISNLVQIFPEVRVSGNEIFRTKVKGHVDEVTISYTRKMH